MNIDDERLCIKSMISYKFHISIVFIIFFLFSITFQSFISSLKTFMTQIDIQNSLWKLE